MKLPGRLIRGSVRPDRASLARFASMRWAALPIVDRRWTAPMSAVALGFGLFVGVAIGPGTEGSFGTPGSMIVEVPASDTHTAQVPAGDDGDKPDRGSSGGNNDSPSSSSDLDDLTGPTAPPLDSTPSSPVIPTPPPISTPPPIIDSTTDTTTDTTEDDTDTTEDEVDEVVTTVLKGTVVHQNPAAGSYTVATEDLRLLAIHSHEPPSVGREVEAEVRQLDNGTYYESDKLQKERKTKRLRGQASLGGIVSFRDPVTGAYTVSAPGVSLLIRGGAQRTPPSVGERVEVDVRIADHPEALPVTPPGQEGCGKPPKPLPPPKTALEQTGLTLAEGELATFTDVEAIVQGVCRTDRKLIVSADDVRESGRDFSIAVPKDLRIADLAPGQVLKLGAAIGSQGALTLVSVSSDKGKQGAENPSMVQAGETAEVDSEDPEDADTGASDTDTDTSDTDAGTDDG
jgi:hypothetical protein